MKNWIFFHNCISHVYLPSHVEEERKLRQKFLMLEGISKIIPRKHNEVLTQSILFFFLH